jgi:hypothetical protein
MSVGIRHADHVAPSIHTHTKEISTNFADKRLSLCRIVSSRTQATEFIIIILIVCYSDILALNCTL